MIRGTRHPVLAGTIATWFALTVVGQKLWRTPGRRSRWDALHLLLPDWRFFAPDPGVYDHHVLVRTRSVAGDVALWTEFTSVGPRKTVHTVWHPRQRVDKALFDVCAELLRFVDTRSRIGTDHDEARRAVQLSVPYLTLLRIAASADHVHDSAAVQWMVAVSGGWDDEPPEVVFLSEWHPTSDRPMTPPGHRSGRTPRKRTEGDPDDELDREARAGGVRGA